ncbi:MAG TPA: NAD(P)/FAD-dependent oxidoreductase [Candidatus Polarisedimenticolaceae bacterium]|nr:NAD(P)/FAD-dependent oxidoreductase [Candidatus Polarisedimenticolaceae bacterium]
MAQELKSDVVVIGGGPVGMFAALELHGAGVGVQVYDAGRRRAMHSYALVLHADTLAMLAAGGLGDAIRNEGRPIAKLGLFDGGKRLGDIELGTPVVVLPQSKLEALLEAALDKRGIKVHWDHRVQDIAPHAAGVKIGVAKLEKVSTGYPVAHTEVVVDKTFDVEASYIVAADGYDSFVRRRLNISDTRMGKGQLFSVFQFETTGDVPGDGRLMLEPQRVGAYWPLPGGHARFSFPIDLESEHHADDTRLRQLIAERAPWFKGHVGRLDWTAVGLFERKLATSFGSGRVWLAGDAAHLTGPIGAQSMNVGLREAKELASAIDSAGNGRDASALERYGASRMSEWNALFAPEPRAGDPRSQIKPCLPASGNELAEMLARVTL